LKELLVDLAETSGGALAYISDEGETGEGGKVASERMLRMLRMR